MNVTGEALLTAGQRETMVTAGELYFCHLLLSSLCSVLSARCSVLYDSSSGGSGALVARASTALVALVALVHLLIPQVTVCLADS